MLYLRNKFKKIFEDLFYRDEHTFMIILSEEDSQLPSDSVEVKIESLIGIFEQFRKFRKLRYRQMSSKIFQKVLLGHFFQVIKFHYFHLFFLA